MLGRKIKMVSFSDPKKIGLKAVKTRLFAKSKLERKVLFLDERLTYHDCPEFLVDFKFEESLLNVNASLSGRISTRCFYPFTNGKCLSYLLIL